MEERNTKLRSSIQELLGSSEFKKYEKLRDQVRRASTEIEVGQKNIKHLERAIARARDRKRS